MCSSGISRHHTEAAPFPPYGYLAGTEAAPFPSHGHLADSRILAAGHRPTALQHYRPNHAVGPRNLTRVKIRHIETDVEQICTARLWHGSGASGSLLHLRLLQPGHWLGCIIRWRLCSSIPRRWVEPDRHNENRARPTEGGSCVCRSRHCLQFRKVAAFGDFTAKKSDERKRFKSQ